MWVMYCSKFIDSFPSTNYAYSFGKAQKEFHAMIKRAVGKKGLKKQLKMIRHYCKVNYPSKQVPKAFADLKTFLTRYFTDPDFYPDPETFTFAVFEDENVKFGRIDDKFVIQTKNKDIKKCFPYEYIPIQICEEEGTQSDFYFDGYLNSLFSEQHYEAYLWIECNEEDADEDEDEDDEDEYGYDDEDDEGDDVYEAPCAYHARSTYRSGYSHPAPAYSKKKNGLTYMEEVELRQARSRYERAVNRCKMHAHSSSIHIYEADEKKALADLMKITAKYAGRM